MLHTVCIAAALEHSQLILQPIVLAACSAFVLDVQVWTSRTKDGCPLQPLRGWLDFLPGLASWLPPAAEAEGSGPVTVGSSAVHHLCLVSGGPAWAEFTYIGTLWHRSLLAVPA